MNHFEQDHVIIFDLKIYDHFHNYKQSSKHRAVEALWL